MTGFIEHPPVMVDEVLEYLAVRPGLLHCDGTLGQGGHLLAILPRLGPDGRAIALDLDPESLAAAQQRLTDYVGQVTYLHCSFGELAEVAAEHAPDGFDRILLDLGLTLAQTKGRFSFQGDRPLDFRLDPTRGRSAAELLATTDQPELERVLSEYGGERYARRIAGAVLEARRREPLQTTAQLVELIRRAYPANQRHGRIHLATRTFQALRYWCNDMEGTLRRALADAPAALRPGGRLAVIAYHSAEDRLVKQSFVTLAQSGDYERVTRKAVQCSDDERRANPGARSARLRVLARRGDDAAREG